MTINTEAPFPTDDSKFGFGNILRSKCPTTIVAINECVHRLFWLHEHRAKLSVLRFFIVSAIVVPHSGVAICSPPTRKRSHQQMVKYIKVLQAKEFSQLAWSFSVDWFFSWRASRLSAILPWRLWHTHLPWDREPGEFAMGFKGPIWTGIAFRKTGSFYNYNYT